MNKPLLSLHYHPMTNAKLDDENETLTLEGWNRFWTWLGKKIGLLI